MRIWSALLIAFPLAAHALSIQPFVETMTLEQAQSVGVNHHIQAKSAACYGQAGFEVTVPPKHRKASFVGAYLEQPWNSSTHRALLYAQPLKDRKLLSFCPWPTKALLVIQYGDEPTAHVSHELRIPLHVPEYE
jgi:hypothetical protein